MVDVAAAVARWTTALATDPAAFGECYAADAQVVALDGSPAPTGRAEVREAAARLAMQVPDRAWVTRRVLADPAGQRVVVEGELTGSGIEDLVTMTTPSLRWWSLDDAGRIATEHVALDWSRRTIRDPGAATAPAAPVTGPSHSTGWYRDLAQRFAESWSWEPTLAVRALYADDVRVEELGLGRGRDRLLEGIAAVTSLEAARFERLGRPDRRMTVLDVVGTGATMAILVAVEGRVRPPLGDPWPPPLYRLGAAVLTLDESDRARHARWFADWSPLD